MDIQQMLAYKIENHEKWGKRLEQAIRANSIDITLKHYVLNHFIFFNDWLVNGVNEERKAEQNYLRVVWIHTEYIDEVKSILDDAESNYTDLALVRLQDNSKFKMLTEKLSIAMKKWQASV